MYILKKNWLGILLLLGSFYLLQAQITITPNKSDGVFSIGQTANWEVRIMQEQPPDSIHYSIKNGGLTVLSEGSLDFRKNTAQLRHQFKTPGAVLLEVRWKSAGNKWHSAIGGAIADPSNIPLSGKKPIDFDAFWAQKIKELSAIPKQPQLRRILLENEKSIEYYHTKMRSIDQSHIRGQLAKPANGEKLPALLVVQWAGVYPLQPSWAVDKAKEGWLVLNINAHDLPIDREQAFYKDKREGSLKNYPAIENEDKDKSYFLRMYLSCYRAAQYLTERPDWDGETLVVMGASQGGLQSLITAGLHPKISAALALVPAGFDTMGPTLGRKGGWPHWYTNTKNKDVSKVHRTSRYFDVANFIPAIKCPVLVGIGLLDTTCPPAGIYAGLNQLTSFKELLLLPKSEHQSKEGSQDAYHERVDTYWLPKLKNKTFPLK